MEEICVPWRSAVGTNVARFQGMAQQPIFTDEPEPTGPEGVPVDAPGNTGPAISPHAVSRMSRAEDDEQVKRHSPDFTDEHLKPKP